MVHLTRSRRARRGFTLVEMMFAIAIILVLVALTVAAIYKFRDTGPASATATNIGKIKGPFDAQWREVRDAAMKERLPDGWTGSFSDPTTRQKYVAARLAQVFPMTYREALSPQSPLQAIPAYQKYLASLNINANSTDSAPVQQAVCLLMALQLGPSNGGVNPDNLGTTMVTKIDLSNQTKAFAILDGWGKPLLFSRDLNGKGPAIYCLGPDNKLGTDDDISSLNP